MPDSRNKKSSDDDLDWVNVSYKTIYSVLALVLLIAGGYLYARYGREAAPAGPVAGTTTAATTARFTSIDGAVKVKAVGTFEWVNANRNITLKKSDLVRTGPGAAAEITFFDGTVVHVRPDSLITIEETSEDPSTRRRKVAWHISSGEVNFQTVRANVPGSATEVSTPTVKSTVGENSAANIRVAQTGDSDIRLFRGSGRVETKGGQTVALAGNEAVKVDASGDAGEKISLPNAPALLAPAHQSEISYADPARSTTLLVWRPVPGAASYRLMLDYSASFSRPLVDQDVRDTSQELRGLEEGKYYWRVAAVDRSGNEGPFSDFARFGVTKPLAERPPKGAPPPLSIDSLDVRTNILQIKGRTEPGASVTVNGQRIDVQVDGSFNEFVTLEKLGKQVIVVRAVGVDGGVNEQRRTVVAAY
ncbi:MAG: FecR domain-containing protein [Vicinamibacteria bacterium]